MQKLSLTLALLISMTLISQEKKEFRTELNEFVLQCENIGRSIIDTNKTTNLYKWYDGRSKELAETNIKQLESDIDNSILEVTYHLTMVYKDPLLYRLNFYSKETRLELGQLYLSFRNNRDNLVDGIKLLSKENIELINLNPAEK